MSAPLEATVRQAEPSVVEIFTTGLPRPKGAVVSDVIS
jgi:hypothetical protein